MLSSHSAILLIASTQTQTPQAQSCRRSHPAHHNPLAGSSLDLLAGTLGALLACNSRCLSLCCGTGALCLLSLLGGGSLGLLVLALLNRSGASSSTSLWALGAALLDHIEGSTDNGTLGLDCAAGALLGNFL